MGIRVGLRELLINGPRKKKLQNTNVSLLAGDCIGGTSLHELGLRFNSPTVNLWFYPQDFIKYVKNIKHYSEQKLEFVKEENIDYPVAKLDDIKVYFTHYESEEHARSKWEERNARINFDNIFVIMTDANGCTEEMMREFDAIPYPHVLFTHKPCSVIKSAFYCKHDALGLFFSYAGRLTIRKYFDAFDFAAWYNRDPKMKNYL